MRPYFLILKRVCKIRFKKFLAKTSHKPAVLLTNRFSPD